MLWIGGIAAVVVLAAAAGIIFRFYSRQSTQPREKSGYGHFTAKWSCAVFRNFIGRPGTLEDSTNLSDASNTQDSSEAPPLLSP